MSVKLDTIINNDNLNLNVEKSVNPSLASLAANVAKAAKESFLGAKTSDVDSLKQIKAEPEISLDEFDELGIKFPSETESSSKVYDHVVVGGGVAGVFTAEILSRDGSSVALVEKHQRIGEESSGEQHGWGQFGALYLNGIDPAVSEACLHNVDLLKGDYAPLAGNNLRADDAGNLISKDPDNKGSWYRSDPIYYYYPDSSDKHLKLDDKEKENWDKTLGRVLHRTGLIAQHDWSSKKETPLKSDEKLEKQAHFIKKGVRNWKKKVIERNPEGALAKREKADKIFNRDIENYSIVDSHDRPMRSVNILSSVHDQFIRNGGEDVMGTEIASYRERGDAVELQTKTGETIVAKNVIYTAGGGINGVEGAKTKTVLSPLLVVTPAVCERNFVHVTPRMNQTINHIFHEDPTSGKSYSLIGNGHAIPPGDKSKTEESRAETIRLAEELFPDLKQMPKENKVVYFGHKNEIVKEGGERNYHFELVPLNKNNVWAAVPGKFTLAPSLAHHIYHKIHGKKAPAIPTTDQLQIAQKAVVAPQLHRQIVAQKIEDPALRQTRNRM